MLFEISVGEGLDRYSILELKQAKISDARKLAHVKNELESLGELVPFIEQYRYYYDLMIHVNTKIWEYTDTIRTLTSPVEYGTLAKTIFNLNQSRFRIKDIINKMTTSSIKEQKNNSTTRIQITLNDSDQIDCGVLTQASLEYDEVCISCTPAMRKMIEECIPPFNYTYCTSL